MASSAPPSGPAVSGASLAVEWVPLESVRPYPGNPRRNAPAVAAVADSLRQFGWRQPLVVDAEGVIVVGHTRWLAARRLRLARVPVHRAADLTPEQARAYRLADNRTADEATWDLGLLGEELRALEAAGVPLDGLGFTAAEIAGHLAGAGRVDPEAADGEAGEVGRRPRTRPGDLIRLGPHRLLCGDATTPEAWARALPEGRRADVVWTDPPYGVAYEGATKEKLRIQNDDLDPQALEALLEAALGLAHVHSRPGATWFVAAPHGPLFHVFGGVLLGLGVWRQTLVWVKDTLVLGHSDFQYRHEPVLAGEVGERPADRVVGAALCYGWREGAPHQRPGSRRLTSVWEVPKPPASREHPTMKPVPLVAGMLEASSQAGALVVDPFCGSGTTLLAADATGRVGVGIELDPVYCDRAASRWERLTGIEPVWER